MIVKICGVTTPDDARMVASSGADWIGLNFWPRSRRWVNLSTGRALAQAAREANPAIVVVGVFVNQMAGVQRVANEVGLDCVQLHGDESPADCAGLGHRVVKAVSLAGADDIARLTSYGCDTVLVDTPSEGYGGSGETFDWKLARAAVAAGPSIILAGGLHPDNVADAVAQVQPFGVDVASGVESSPGVKDADAVRRFVLAAKGAKGGS